MITLSATTRQELEGMLEDLAREAREIQERSEAIRRVLGKEPLAHLSWSMPSRPKIEIPPTKPVEPAFGDGLTMREVVKAEIRANPGWKAADVTTSLRKKKYTRGGTTRFSHRVYNEIWRMAKDGLVKREPNGGFRLAEGGN